MNVNLVSVYLYSPVTRILSLFELVPIVMVLERIMSQECSKRQGFNVICPDDVKKICSDSLG